jgi:hypothetical protein
MLLFRIIVIKYFVLNILFGTLLKVSYASPMQLMSSGGSPLVYDKYLYEIQEQK